MIKIRNLSYQYQNTNSHVLDNIEFDLLEGEVGVLLGESGIGKSTILKVLAGIIKDYKGEILLDGEKIDTRKHKIGLIPQDNGLIPWMRVKENLLVAAEIKKNYDELFFCELISALKIEELLYQYPSELSGGQQKRVAIGRALLMKPKLLLMDEPFASLDENTRCNIQKLFLSIHNKYKITTLVVTHSYLDGLYLGEKLILLGNKPGKILKIIENKLAGKSLIDYKIEYEAEIIKLQRIMKESKLF